MVTVDLLTTLRRFSAFLHSFGHTMPGRGSPSKRGRKKKSNKGRKPKSSDEQKYPFFHHQNHCNAPLFITKTLIALMYTNKQIINQNHFPKNKLLPKSFVNLFYFIFQHHPQLEPEISEKLHVDRLTYQKRCWNIK